ncbi:MAG: alpha-hydroxy-acid oxidizing protein [Chromatiales bacterium]
MSREGFAYVAGGAGTESTQTQNRAAFERWRIVPRVLRDVSSRDLSVRLLGDLLPAPLLLAPIGALEMAHRKADLAVARAAAALGVPMIVSSQASRPLEACASAMGDTPRWFQIYRNKSNEVVASLVQRAEAAGFSAIVLTVDTGLLAWRPRDLDLGYLPFLRGRGIAQYTSDPVFRETLTRLSGVPLTPAAAPVWLHRILAFANSVRRFPGPLLAMVRLGTSGAQLRHFLATFSHPSLCWNDLGFVRNLTRLPVLLKGILHPDDARRAVDAGIDGIIVSNHGGRQMDGAIAALDALPGVVDAVNGRVPVLMDSGIRCGADMFKALALGAAAVTLGRPYVYGLAIAGERGVRDVMRNLIAEFDLTMALAGCRNLEEVRREMLTAAP